MDQSESMRSEIYGIEFSGAEDPSHNIWVAFGKVTQSDGPKELRINRCVQLIDLMRDDDSLRKGPIDNKRSRSYAALTTFISKHPQGIFGIDFPFGLPRRVITRPNWEEFILNFPEDYSDCDPELFRTRCLRLAENRLAVRRTDRDSPGTQSPYDNFNAFHQQTFFGISQVLYNLVLDVSARVIPMQTPEPHLPWVVETCPVSTLKDIHIYREKYSGAGKDDERARIIERLRNWRVVLTDDVARVSERNSDANALDSIIAAYAVYRNLTGLPGRTNRDYELEGRIYL